jgi:hypothetical protein
VKHHHAFQAVVVCLRGLVIDWGKQHYKSIQGVDLIMELKDIDPIYVVSFDF